MPFLEDGFLEADEQTRIAQIRLRWSSWFALVSKLNRLAMSVMLAEIPRVPEELYVATLYARAVSLFQGAVRMTERGMITEALTLVRSCAETAIALGCVRLDSAFLERLDEDDDKYRVATANDLLSKLPEDDPNISAEQREALRQMIAEVSRRYKKPNPLRINWASAAIDAKLVDLYITVYRQTSRDAAHVSITALDRHIAVDAKGDISGLRFQPDIDRAADTLSAAIASLFHATEAKLNDIQDSANGSTLHALAHEWRGLLEAPDYPIP